jgi:signal transduction histidine kinase
MPSKHTAEEAMRRAQQAQNLKRMAEIATVGMYDMDLNGRLLSANNVFFEMCGLPKVDPAVVEVRPWEVCVFKEDYPLLVEKLKKLVEDGVMQNVEVRLTSTWTADDVSGRKVTVPRIVQATMIPERGSDGNIKSFTGCLNDVSLQKWQLDSEMQRKNEAIESKRQQENFIDMTSHEMRNPLSAILHCADAITATLSRVQELLGDEGISAIPAAGGGIAAVDDGWVAEVRELVESGIDNAETIVTCAQHQKRIVDDILTMSKLDSSLISITRVTVDPIKMVKEALRMFEVEARRVDINLSMVVDPCYYELGIKYLELDPSRLKQVLINLLTNALKFTKTGPTRNVTVAVRASLTRPTEASSKVSFIPRSEPLPDVAKQCRHDDLKEEQQQPVPANRANPVYLMFEVEDTGEGLTEDEKKTLFQRFVQASSRTHVKYGGSGLGLFISRRLTELQNGAIGVASKPGVGSTFAFYIEAYRPTEEAVREADALSRACEEDESSPLPGLRSSPMSFSPRGSLKRGSISFSYGTLNSGPGSSNSSVHSVNIGGNASNNNNNSIASSVENGNGKAKTNGASTSTGGSCNSVASSGSRMVPYRSLSQATLRSRHSSESMTDEQGPLIRGVLIVEDNLINQQITRRGLSSLGFTVDVANHGVEALEKLRRSDRFDDGGKAVGVNGGKVNGVGEDKSGAGTTTVVETNEKPTTSHDDDDNSSNTAAGEQNINKHPTSSSSNGPPQRQTNQPPPPFPLSIILMDIEMPIQDGLTCTRRIRELEAHGKIKGGRIPIIAVSANARLEQIVEARQAGCDDVLVKPYRMPELVEMMRDVMARVGGRSSCVIEAKG